MATINYHCTGKDQTGTMSTTLSNFRVEYHAPDYYKGHFFEPCCAILADDAELNGATVCVFDVPDPDGGQREVAQFACDAMNGYERMIEALRNILADCEDAQERRTAADFDFATLHAVEYARAALPRDRDELTTKPTISGKVTRIGRSKRNSWRAETLVDSCPMSISHHDTKADAETAAARMIRAYAEAHYVQV